MDPTNIKLIDNKKTDSEKLTIPDSFPIELKRHMLSFLSGNDIQSRTINNLYFSPFLKESLFTKDKLIISAATKCAHNLAHRIDEKNTLAFMRKNTNVLQSFSNPIEIIDSCGRPIKRPSIIEVLAALDEFSVVETMPETKPYDLISIIFSWFNQKKDPRNCHITKQLQQQLKKISESQHVLKTKERREHYLQEIEIFIKKVIQSSDILNDVEDAVPFENILDLELVQDFIKNAFKPILNDNGEWGVVWDCWQLNLDYIALLNTYVNNDSVSDKSRPNLGGWWSRKTDVVDIAVYMAFLRSSQYCHLEVYARGIGKVSSAEPPTRLDCSRGLPNILDGIGVNYGFGFYGDKLLVTLPGGWRRGGILFKAFVEQKHQHYKTYATTDARQAPLSGNVEIRSSPS